ncbi:MAG: YncE family protein [Woeseia sp.]
MRTRQNVCRLITVMAGFWTCAAALAQYDDGARYAFIASPQDKTVYVIDLQDRTLADSIDFELAPDSVSASENLRAIVVAHEHANRLTLVDLSSDALTKYDYPLTITPDSVDVSPLGETVAIYDSQAKKLEVHAIRRRHLLLEAEDVNTAEEFTFNLDGSTIYWVDRSTGTVNSIDLWSKREALSLAPPNTNLSGLSRSIDGAHGFISNAAANVVYVVSLTTFQEIGAVRTGMNPGRPWGTADGRYMLIPNQGDGTVTAISTLSLQPLYTVSAVDNPVSINPGWLDTTAAIIGETGDVVFLNVDDGKLTEKFELASRPNEGVVTSDSRTLMVPVPGAGSVSFFDMRKRSFVSETSGLGRDIGEASLAISNNLCH